MPITSLMKDAAGLLGFKGRGTRSFERHAVCIPAGLRLEGRTYDLLGVVLELSRGGALFREASEYILDRNGTAGELKLPEINVPVVIVSSRGAGYGVRFSLELSEIDVANFVAEYGMSTHSWSPST